MLGRFQRQVSFENETLCGLNALSKDVPVRANLCHCLSELLHLVPSQLQLQSFNSDWLPDIAVASSRYPGLLILSESDAGDIFQPGSFLAQGAVQLGELHAARDL